MTAAATTTTTDFIHGYTGYVKRGCRCYTCCFAKSEYEHARRERLAEGGPDPFVDAEPVREHIRTLSRAKVGLRDITAATGVSPSTLSIIMYGRPSHGEPPPPRMTRVTADKILALAPVPPSMDTARTDGVGVDSTGTVRRVHSLVRRGFPQSYLADRLGISETYLSAILQRPAITAVNARTIRDLYTVLENADPVAEGVPELRARMAADRAQAQNWPLPAMWDDEHDIDDPEAFPDYTGACGTPRGYNLHSYRKIPYCDPCRDARKAAA